MTVLVPGASAGADAGALDHSFSSDGRVVTDLQGADHARAVAVRGDGQILVAGRTRNKIPALVRYRRSGNSDRGFGKRGETVLPGWNKGEFTVVIHESGKIIVAGSSGGGHLGIARFRRDGQRDRGFKGSRDVGIPGINRAEDVAIQDDGKILVVGHTRGLGNGAEQLVVARFRRDGRLDHSFSEDGWLITRFEQDTYVLGYGVAIQDDGRIVVSGEVGNSWILARFLPDGTLDESFGNDGGVAHSGPVSVGIARDVAVRSDGRIVSAGREIGEFDGGIGVRFALARNMPDGAPDPSFGDGGAVHTTFYGDRPHDNLSAMQLAPGGKIVVAGTAELPTPGGRGRDPHFAVVRYLANGSLDKSFAGDGKRVVGMRPGYRRRQPPSPVFDRAYDFAEDLALAPGGRIVVAGYSFPFRRDEDFAIARLQGR